MQASHLCAILRLISGGFAIYSRHLTPQADVRNSLVVARNHNFGPLRDGATILAARAAHAAGSHLRINDFADSALADWNAHPAQYADHFRVGWIHVLVLGNKHPAQEQKNDSTPDQAPGDREE